MLALPDLKILSEIWDEAVPTKVRKVRLLQALDLPLNPGTVVLESVSVSGEDGRAFASECKALLEKWETIIVRTAWKPDIQSSPYFHVRSTKEVASVVPKLRQLCSDNACTHIILHGEVVNADERSERRRYLAGRVMYHPYCDLPTAKTLEMLTEEYFAKILDHGSKIDLRRFARCRRDVATMMWRIDHRGDRICDQDIRLAVTKVNSIESKVELLIAVLGHCHNSHVGELAVVVEFGCCRGPENIFIVFDFDYVLPQRI